MAVLPDVWLAEPNLLTCNALWALMTGGNSIVFRRPLIVPLHNPNSRHLLAVRAVQGDCKRVYPNSGRLEQFKYIRVTSALPHNTAFQINTTCPLMASCETIFTVQTNFKRLECTFKSSRKISSTVIQTTDIKNAKRMMLNTYRFKLGTTCIF